MCGIVLYQRINVLTLHVKYTHKVLFAPTFQSWKELFELANHPDGVGLYVSVGLSVLIMDSHIYLVNKSDNYV